MTRSTEGAAMPTYVVLYKFTPDGVKTIRDSVKRAGAVRQQNAAAGFNIREVFWTQGPYDMVAVIDAPSEEKMMGAMLNVVSAGNAMSTTMRAFDATAMSRIMATVEPLPREAQSVPKTATAPKATSKNGASRNGAGAKARPKAKAGARRR
jgi:uncharacterized protein with GYD domain